jgi:HK97 family phage portal protein
MSLKDNAKSVLKFARSVYVAELSNHLGKIGVVKSADTSWPIDVFDRVLPWQTNRLTNQRDQMKAYLDWVYAAASAVALDVATIDFHAYANRSSTKSSKMAKRLMRNPRLVREYLKAMPGGGQLEELDDHIALDLLDTPNPIMDGSRFMEMTTLHLILAGEAFWGKIRNKMGVVVQLWPMLPYQMRRSFDGKGWVFTSPTGQESPWDESEIVHIVLTDPNRIDRGMSVVRAAARAIETDTHAADWNMAFFRNSARPDLYLETEQTLSTTTFDRMKAQWSAEYQGTSNAHKVAILEAGLKASKAIMTQKDMDFLETRKFGRDQILAMMGVSKSILGLIEDANRANMEAADYNHAKRVVKPLMSRITSTINHSLAPDFDSKLVIGFTDPVPEDKEFALKERVQSINAYRTINEAREEAGLEKIEGGDTMYMTNNMVPLGTPPPEPVAPSDANADPKADDPNADPAKKAHEGVRVVPKVSTQVRPSARP